jgi:hypothetical protein
MPKPILIGSAVRASAAAAIAASAEVKPATQARTAPPPVKLFIGMVLPASMLLFLAYLNSFAFASGGIANEFAGQLSTPRVFGHQLHSIPQLFSRVRCTSVGELIPAFWQTTH